MSDDGLRPVRPNAGRIRFSLGTLMLWIAVVCLAGSQVVTLRELAKLQREVDAARPLTVSEVARQFEESTTVGPLTVKVRDVRYSLERDAYKVSFSWTDAQSQQTWSSDVQLVSDGFGAYYGQIHNGPFLDPLGMKDGFAVVVSMPSALAP